MTVSLSRRLFIVATTIAVFLAVDTNPWWLYQKVWDPEASQLSKLFGITTLRYILPWFVVPVVVTGLLFGARNALKELGLAGSFLKGWAVGLAGCSVMVVGYMIVTDFNPPANLFNELMRYTVLPAFFEEVLYRGFLFGLLFRYGKIGFLPASLLAAVFFGAGHLYQGGTPGEAAAIALITASGAVWFAWLYTEWDFNLWVPISFHMLMNGLFTLFPVGEQAFVNGDMAGNVLRLAVISLSIVLTLMFSRRGKGRVISKRGWLWGGPRN